MFPSVLFINEGWIGVSPREFSSRFLSKCYDTLGLGRRIAS